MLSVPWSGCLAQASGVDSGGRSWLDGLLGLRDVSLGETETYLALARPLPGWAWVLIAAVALTFVWWLYHRQTGSRPVRGALALARALAVAWVVLLLCGPEVVRPSERVEPDVLVMLVDRSASMRVPDVRVDELGDASVVSRDDALRGALDAQWDAVATALPGDREVAWLGFGPGVFGLGADQEDRGNPENQEDAHQVALPLLGDADQPRTRLRTAVEDAVRRAAGRPVAGLVVFSDGQSGEAVSAALLSRLRQAGVRVFAVPVGAAEPGVDWAVGRVDAPARAFAKDDVPVSVVVERRGGRQAQDAQENQETQEVASGANVRLVDTRGTDDPTDDVVLDEQMVDADALTRPVRLRGRSETEGTKAWAVVVEAEGDGSSELNTNNNRDALTVEIVDRPIRVLYVEGTPRWEYRYLKNLLVREPSIDSSVLLLSADASFAQEGDTPITRLPADAEEFGRYDVVVIGDVPGAFFSDEQVALVRDLVSRRGAGLLWVGGPDFTPNSWAGTRLSDLLPMVEPGGVTVWPGGLVDVRPTPLAGALSVLRLEAGDDDETETGSSGLGAASLRDWPVGLEPLRWVQVVGALKPVAEVLAVGLSDVGPADDGEGGSIATLPVVVRMRYGSGQAVYVATDETWRWRRGIGERYPERFYVQLIRMLGRGAVVVGDERARLSASTRVALEGEPVVIDLAVDDPALLPEASEFVAVRVTAVDENDSSDAAASVGNEVRLQIQADDALPEGGALGVTYTGTWTADRPGVYRVVPLSPGLSSLASPVEVEVVSPDDELRRPETDHAKLEALAVGTGGRVLGLDELHRLNEPGFVRSVARRVADDRAESVTNSPLAFGVLLLLLAIEWSVRRAIRLA